MFPRGKIQHPALLVTGPVADFVQITSRKRNNQGFSGHKERPFDALLGDKVEKNIAHA